MLIVCSFEALEDLVGAITSGMVATLAFSSSAEANFVGAVLLNASKAFVRSKISEDEAAVCFAFSPSFDPMLIVFSFKAPGGKAEPITSEDEAILEIVFSSNAETVVVGVALNTSNARLKATLLEDDRAVVIVIFSNSDIVSVLMLIFSDASIALAEYKISDGKAVLFTAFSSRAEKEFAVPKFSDSAPFVERSILENAAVSVFTVSGYTELVGDILISSPLAESKNLKDETFGDIDESLYTAIEIVGDM